MSGRLVSEKEVLLDSPTVSLHVTGDMAGPFGRYRIASPYGVTYLDPPAAIALAKAILKRENAV